MQATVGGKEMGGSKHLSVIIFLLRSLTVCLDVGKAIWNILFLLLLLDSGYSVAQVGIVKSSSNVAKETLQLVPPALEDNGVFAKFFPPSVSSHILADVASILSDPLLQIVLPTQQHLHFNLSPKPDFATQCRRELGRWHRCS